MNPDYKRKLDEIEEWEREQRERERANNTSFRVPNLERMPLGCLLWIAAVAIGIFYLFRGCGQ